MSGRRGGMRRRDAAAALAVAAAAPWSLAGAQPAAPARAARPAAGRPPGVKLLRIAFNTAETGFDPAKVFDLYSRTVTPHIFEGLYHYDHLARPYRVRPLTAAGMPEVSADFRVWTVRLRPGILFQDDPAFGGPHPGKGRELVAEDYVYALKRFADPANNSPAVSGVIEAGLLGLEAVRERAIRERRPFDYDAPVPGLRALDRHTVRFELAGPRPRFLEFLATGDLFGAVAREVVEHYGDAIMAHPVGTGPYRLVQWRRSSLIVLERNPGYRERVYDGEPAPDDAAGQAIAQRLRGRRIPIVDRVEVSIIEESQPRWLAFLNGQLDFLNVPSDYVAQAMPHGRVAPNLARRGIRGERSLNADIVYLYFNMDDPVVGGEAADKVALRRAIGLALDVPRLIALLYRGQGVPAQSIVLPFTSGWDPAFKSEMGDHDPVRAKALLDLFGYLDRDGDSWRERPDGSPLVLELATQPDQFSRQFDEVLAKNLRAIGVRLRFFTGQWPEQLKAARAGRLQLWLLGGSAASPDGQDSLAAFYSEQIGGQNFARFRHSEMDTIYERAQALPDGPERDALFRRAKIIATAYMPYKMMMHRFSNDLVHGHLVGYRRPQFWTDWWHMVDIEDDAAPELSS